MDFPKDDFRNKAYTSLSYHPGSAYGFTTPRDRKELANITGIYAKFSPGDYVYIERIDRERDGDFDVIARKTFAKIVKVTLPRGPGFFHGFSRGNLTFQMPTGEVVDLEEYSPGYGYIISKAFRNALENSPQLGSAGWKSYSGFYVYGFGNDYLTIKEQMEVVQKEHEAAREKERIRQLESEKYRAQQAAEEQERLLREQERLKLGKEAEKHLDHLFNSL